MRKNQNSIIFNNNKKKLKKILTIHIFNKLDRNYKILTKIKSFNLVEIRYKMNKSMKSKKLPMNPKLNLRHSLILKFLNQPIIYLKNLIILLTIFKDKKI